MNQYQWLNRSQPQTLQNATILCYLAAVFGVIGGVPSTSKIAALFIVVGLAVGGWGIANEKRWAYVLAVAAAGLQVAFYLIIFGADVFRIDVILSFGFDVALVALLLHPQSRSYQRIWFK